MLCQLCGGEYEDVGVFGFEEVQVVSIIVYQFVYCFVEGDFYVECIVLDGQELGFIEVEY